MQTFLVFESFEQTARALDSKRLGKQRVEAKQILLAMETKNAWFHHPAVKMWQGYESGLAVYGASMSQAFRDHGYKDNLLDEFNKKIASYEEIVYPPWIVDPLVHETHRSNLVRKLPTRYEPMFRGVEPDLPYAWPSFNENGDYTLRVSAVDIRKRGFEGMPYWWKVDQKTRVIVPKYDLRVSHGVIR